VATKITVRKATHEDLEELLRIQRESLPQAAEWSAGALLAGLEGCFAAQKGDRVVGFLLYRQLGSAEWEILNLAVDQQTRRQGVASRLIEEFLGGANGDVYLEVRESNHAARALYARWGFSEDGWRRGYYHHPVEDAVVMKRTKKNIVYTNEA
jgi:[ribosomal protein S18]-alanine N-acetyltransferase